MVCVVEWPIWRGEEIKSFMSFALVGRLLYVSCGEPKVLEASVRNKGTQDEAGLHFLHLSCP